MSTEPKDTKSTDETKDEKNEEKTNDLKADISLSLLGIPEYNQYPFEKSNDKFLFMASIKAPRYRETKRAPIDLICIIDESSSMEGQRIDLVKETAEFVVKNLESSDRFGCVGYSTDSREIFPLTAMTDDNKKKAIDKIVEIQASGSTALCAGLVQGLQMMRKRNFKNDVASVMLFTDGQANIGHTNARDIIRATVDEQFSETNSNSKSGMRQTKKKDKKEKSYKEEIISTTNDQKETVSDEGKLPCTINTFGFGNDHNAALLQAIAEHGRGMYAFIEKTDQIADTFAECLGGLVSVIAQNVKITVERLNDVTINRCISQGYSIEIPKQNEKYVVSINDIQSEENRDIIFELTLPSLKEKKEKAPIIQLSTQYKNVVKNENEIKSTVCELDRIEGNDIGERNDELDLQVNRIVAADAMNQADTFAQQGKLQDARNILDNAVQVINKSKTGKKEYSANLVKDINSVQSNLQDRKQYDQVGSKVLKMKKEVHKMQRSVQSSNNDSEENYTNHAKKSMKAKFKK